MTMHSLTRRGLLIVALPVAAVLAGGVGVAVAATGGSGHDTTSGQQSYHSSVTTSVNDDNGTEAAQDLALTKLATVTLTQATQAAGQAVAGGTVISVELDNEDGNVVYTADVVTDQGETEVVVDAGNGHILSQQADRDDDHDNGDEATDGTSPATGAATTNGPTSSSTPSQP